MYILIRIVKISYENIEEEKKMIDFFILGENPSKNDPQPSAAKLSKVSVPLLHGPGAGAALAGQPRPRHREHAGRRQQGTRLGPLSCLRKGDDIFFSAVF